MANGRIVIPPGSYVAGTVTQVKRPGRVKGRGELFLRFDSLTLPNGVTRDFRARVAGVDGRASEEFDKSEGTIKSEGNKSGDARSVGEATAAGTSIGVIAGGAAGHYGMGAGIGAAAGATAGLMGVLLSRGPDAVLRQGQHHRNGARPPAQLRGKRTELRRRHAARPLLRRPRPRPQPEEQRLRRPLPPPPVLSLSGHNFTLCHGLTLDFPDA